VAGESTPGLTEALDAYVAAVTDAGAPPPSDPITDEGLRRVEEAIEPLSLPQDLRTTWARFQVAPLLPFPRLIPAQLALQFRSDVEAGHGSTALFQFGYEAHVDLSVDLTAPSGVASSLWEVHVEDGDARRKYHSIAAFFAAAAEAVRGGILRWHGDYAQTDDLAWDGLVERWNGVTTVDDDLGADEVDLNRPFGWPARWQRHAGLDPETARPRGRTHDIRTLLTGRPTEHATVAGRIVGLAGGADASRITLQDANDEMAIWVPRETDPFWQAVPRAEVEIDVLLLPSVGSGDAWNADLTSTQWAIERAGLGHDMAGAQQLAQELTRMFDPSTCDAIAVAVRPSKWPPADQG
jgi:hypothetical protein